MTNQLLTKTSPSIDHDSLDIVPVLDSSRQRSGRKARNKGSSYERRLCKSFSEFWGSKFFRTPMSGGSALKDDYNLAGDLSTPDESFPYHCEAKNQEAFKGFHTLFTSGKCPVWKWWAQCTEECPTGKTPLLIFTKNYLPSFVMMPYAFGRALESSVEFDPAVGFNEFLRVRDCCAMTLDRFLGFGKDSHLKASKIYWEKCDGGE